MTLTEQALPPATVVRREPPRAEPPPSRGWTGWHLDVGRTFIVVSLIATWVVVYLAVLSGFEQGHAQRELYDSFRTELALGTAPIGAPIDSGTPVALLDVPRAGIDHVIVVEGTGSGELKDGPGHLRGSVLPGQTGISVLLGRSLSFGGPFGSLTDLKAGDPITVTTGQGTFTYRVSGARQEGDPVPAAPAAGTGRLTLVTAVGSGPLARLTPSDAVYFDAVLDKAVGPGPRSAKVLSEQPMKTHVGAGTLAELALALQLLLGVSVAAVWARVRWSSTAAWITGVPMIFAALWLVSSIGSRLLPNLV
jgi:sortase A